MIQPLAKDRFLIPDPDLVYLDGNSLGRPVKAGLEAARKALEEEWPERLIRGWNKGWISRPSRAADKLARIIGAEPGEVAVCDQTSVNLYKAALAALNLRLDRKIILSDSHQFPSDLYILAGLAQERGLELRIVEGGSDQVAQAVDEQTALVCLSQVGYLSGFRHDMALVCSAAQRAGALTLWDLSHAAGAVEVNLNGAGADLAVGCTYKFLNGGPGSPGFLFCAKRLDEARNPIQGWLGHAQPFAFQQSYEPLPDAGRFVSGTPPVLSLAPLEASLDLYLEVGVHQVVERNHQLVNRLEELAKERLARHGFGISTPASRGAHLSLTHPEARLMTQALVERGIIPDFRPPSIIRFGVNSLYNGEEDLIRAVQALEETAEGQLWKSALLPEGPVT